MYFSVSHAFLWVVDSFHLTTLRLWTYSGYVLLYIKKKNSNSTTKSSNSTTKIPTVPQKEGEHFSFNRHK